MYVFTEPQNLDWSKFKTFAEVLTNVAKVTMSVFDRLETSRKHEKMQNTSISKFSHRVFKRFLLLRDLGFKNVIVTSFYTS